MGATQGGKIADAPRHHAGPRHQGRRHGTQDAQLISQTRPDDTALELYSGAVLVDPAHWQRFEHSRILLCWTGDLVDIASRRRLDPEEFCHSWARSGPAAIARLCGDYAVIVADRSSGECFAFRDALGGKPLFYRQDRDKVLLSAFPQAIAASGPDYDWLTRWAGTVRESGPASAFRDVSRVEPGHLVHISGRSGDLHARPWWQPDLSPIETDRVTLYGQAEKLLDRAFRTAMGATDNAIALHLTGGLDSHLVLKTALDVVPAQRLVTLTGQAGGAADAPLADEFADDGDRAAHCARANGVSHFRCAKSPRSLLAADLDWARQAGRPIGSGEAIGWGEACLERAASLGAPRLITGASGNYSLSWPGVEALSDGPIAARLRRWLGYRRHRPVTLPGLALLSFPWLQHLLGRRARPEGNPFVREFHEEPHCIGADARLSLYRRSDAGTYNAVVAERYGIEERDLFADRELVEFSLRLRPEIFFGDGELRALARDLLRGRADRQVVEEQRRGAQSSDWRAGFELAQDDMREVINWARKARPAAARFSLDAMEAAIKAYDASGWPDASREMVYRYHLPRAANALAFARWAEERR